MIIKNSKSYNINFSYLFIYFIKLLLSNKIQINLFISLIFLFFIHYFFFYVYFLSKKELNYIPIFPLIFFYYWATFSLYFYFNQELKPIRINNAYLVYPEIIFLIKVLSLGLIFFSIGYFILNIFNLKKISYNLNQINNYETYVIITFILYICFYYVNYEIKLFKSSIFAQLKQPTMLFVLSYLQIKYLITKNFFYLMSLIIVLFLLFFIEASFGALFFIDDFNVIIIKLYKSRKINLVSILIIFVAIYGVHSLKNSIRKVIRDHFPEQDNTTTKNCSKAQLKNNEILFRIKILQYLYQRK